MIEWERLWRQKGRYFRELEGDSEIFGDNGDNTIQIFLATRLHDLSVIKHL